MCELEERCAFQSLSEAVICLKGKLNAPLLAVRGHFQGSARRLVKAALQEAAKKREMRYSDLKKIDRGVRRHFHDDITVVVVFLDHYLISKYSSHGPTVSIRWGGSTVPSNSLAPDSI